MTDYQIEDVIAAIAEMTPDVTGEPVRAWAYVRRLFPGIGDAQIDDAFERHMHRRSMGWYNDGQIPRAI